MSQGTPILLERENVNDESVILTQWFVQDGAWVEAGTLIAEVETSKANVEVVAPQAGYLEQGVEAKSDLSYESPIGHLFLDPLPAGREKTRTANSNGLNSAPPLNTVSPSTSVASQSTSVSSVVHSSTRAEFYSPNQYEQRFSRRAEELILEHSLAKDSFAGLKMVRALDVVRLVDGESPELPEDTPAIQSQTQREASKAASYAPRLRTTAVPLSKMKRSEVRALTAGTRNAIPSAVTVNCLTRGLKAALQRNPIVAGNTGAVIVYEAARLLRKYPAFNATYRADNSLRYEQVNIGYAIDDGRGLKVAVLRDCDTRSLAQIADELRMLVLAYVDDKLTPTQVNGATFTISDLSAMGVSSFLPLISEDQGAILGVGGEQFLPGSRDGCYTLTLAFDHQLSEGRTAALFLNDLKDRLLYYEQAMREVATDSPACSRCGRTAAELPDAKSFMVQTAVPAGYLCNLCVAGL